MRLRIKKGILIIGCGLVIIGLTGCSFMHRKAGAGTIGVASLPLYSGPKARIAVADFNIKAAKATGEICSDLREMLVLALTNSNRFSIVERQQVQPAPAAGNSVSQKDAARTPDLIVTAEVSEFEPQASGGRAGVGGGGGVGSGILGGLLGTPLNKAHMALDISILDASTSKTLAATHIQGQASDAKVIKGEIFGSQDLGKGLAAYANTPMEKAIRICIIEAVRYMCQAIPPGYYKYTDAKG